MKEEGRKVGRKGGRKREREREYKLVGNSGSTALKEKHLFVHMLGRREGRVACPSVCSQGESININQGRKAGDYAVRGPADLSWFCLLPAQLG